MHLPSGGKESESGALRLGDGGSAGDERHGQPALAEPDHVAGLGNSSQDPQRPAGPCATPRPDQARLSRSQGACGTLAPTLESRIVGVAALVEGFVLVTFPSASAIITGSDYYGMAGPLYGELVLPELATAILASLTGFGLARRH